MRREFFHVVLQFRNEAFAIKDKGNGNDDEKASCLFHGIIIKKKENNFGIHLLLFLILIFNFHGHCFQFTFNQRTV